MVFSAVCAERITAGSDRFRPVAGTAAGDSAAPVTGAADVAATAPAMAFGEYGAFGSSGFRAKSAVSRNSVKPVLTSPPLVVRAKARVSGWGGWKKTGGAAVTMGARVTRKATVGWRVAVAVGTPACGSTVAGMGETSAGGASAVMKVGVASSVGGGKVGSSAVGAGGCVGIGACAV